MDKTKAKKYGAYDLSRGQALFLVQSVEIKTDFFPDDFAPNISRMFIEVDCSRLEEDLRLCENPENVSFSMHNAWL